MVSINDFTISSGSGGAKPYPSGGADMERVRYFPRQLVTADDLTQDQRYFRAKQRRHNRMLHGWGVVCGCEVTPGTDDWTVRIAPGYVLAPQGDEIVVECEITIDLTRQDLDGNALICDPPADPWCASVRVNRRNGETVFVALAYEDYLARPVRAHPVGCSCDGADCEYSRIRDGFSVKVLDRLPESYSRLDPTANPFACPDEGVRQCAECPSEPWVILCAVTINGSTVQSTDIDNRTHRRYVAALGDWWFRCAESDERPSPPSVRPRNLVLRRAGGGFDPDVIRSFEVARNGRSIVLNIEPDLAMVDGRPFGGETVRDIFEANRERLTDAGFADVELVDDRTVRVTLAAAGRADAFLEAASDIAVAVRPRT